MSRRRVEDRFAACDEIWLAAIWARDNGFDDIADRLELAAAIITDELLLPTLTAARRESGGRS